MVSRSVNSYTCTLQIYMNIHVVTNRVNIECVYYCNLTNYVSKVNM